MLTFIRDWFKQETTLVEKERAAGKKAIRPSSIILGSFALFYLLSPIDIIPEAFVKPKVFGFIDDLIVVLLVGFYIYKDVRGILNETICSSRILGNQGGNKEDNLCSKIGHSGISSDISPTIDSGNIHNSSELLDGISSNDNISANPDVPYSDEDLSSITAALKHAREIENGQQDSTSFPRENEYFDESDELDPGLCGLLHSDKN